MSCPRRPLRAAALAAALLVPTLPAGASESPTAEALIRQEQTRAAVAEAFDHFREHTPDGGYYVAKAVEASDRLVEIGPDAVLYLANEMEQASSITYYFCAFTLGRIGDEASVRALRDALERASVEGGDFAIYRTAWAAMALAMAGEVDALDAFNSGPHVSGHIMMHRETSALEVAAVHIPPAQAIPLLTAQLARYADDERQVGQRIYVLRALRRTADLAALPAVLGILDDPELAGLRNEAYRALGGLPSDASTGALVAAIADPDFLVRRTVALSLSHTNPPAAVPAVLERLVDEDDPVARGLLYRVLAHAGDPADTSWIDTHWGPADAQERRMLVYAVSLLGALRTDRLIEALGDGDMGVTVEAASALVRLRDDAADAALADALRTFDTDRLGPLARAVLPDARPAVLAAAHERLKTEELREAAKQPTVRSSVSWMLEALLDRGMLGVTPTVRTWRETSTDPYLIKELDRLAPMFEQLDAPGRSIGPWTKAAAGDDATGRRLALARLGETTSAKSARALVAAFDRNDLSVDERVEIVRSLADIGRATQAAPLLERVLLDDEYGAYTMRPVRDAAAWTARRLGGSGMTDLLARTVTHRGGRELAPLVYLTLLDPARGAAAIAEHRESRMANLGRPLGDEHHALDRLAREAAAGVPLWFWDHPPSRIPLRY